jgi:NAD(P)-dependent dehydrogenase (short-subunit alcohol dehydrogenase family)
MSFVCRRRRKFARPSTSVNGLAATTKCDRNPARVPVIIGCGKLRDKIALITGGDSGIGRAVAILFAKEGVDAVVYFNEHRAARETKRLVEAEGRKCLLLAGNVGREKFCKGAVERTRRELGGIDILVNNAAEQHPQENITRITEKQLQRTFRTNIFSMFFMTKAVMPHFKRRKYHQHDVSYRIRTPMKWRPLLPIHRCAGPASRKKSPPVLCFSLRKIPPT